MLKKILFSLLIFSLYVPQAFAHSGGLDSTGGHHNRKTGEYHCHRCPCGCATDTNKTAPPPVIERSSEVRGVFMRQNPCPSTGKTSGTCPGYVIDHIIPLKRGGDDTLSNMQWQTVEDAKVQDKVE